MSESKEQIKRLFYPCEEEIPTDADGLLTASEELRKYANLIALDAFARLPGAILLGEGGMGKSTAMRQLQSCFPEGRSHVFELGLFSGNAPGLSAAIESCFDSSRSAVDTGFAILFDGLDEAPELAGPILLKTRELPDRATVWISSRDVAAIRAIQSDAPQLRSYMIAPLSLADIMDLARRSNISAERFVESIARGGITSICAKPIGCDLAISVFQENSLVGVRQVDLWHKGITRLCDETSSPTRRIVLKSNFTLEEVINCCSWIALCLTLSAKTAIWNDQESLCPDNCARLSDIQSGEFSPSLIAASLGRGVFTPGGDGRFRFSHATYRDYLASLGFERFIPAAHWTSLLFTRIKTGVLPQRAGVATWLAARNSGFLDEISGIEPEILLSSVDAIQAIGPSALCRALLDRSDAISYQQRHNSAVAKNLFRLSGTATCDAIRERLIDQNAGDTEIDFAIEIAKACQCTDLANILVDRVLNQNLPYHHRVAASHAVLSLDNRSAKGRLKALLPLDSVEDPIDDLRGNVLRCCWPDHLTVGELLENLSPPQRSNYLGAYGMFLDYELPASFKEVVNEEAACKLLKWSTDHVARDQVLDRVGRLAGRIYSYCWQWATVPAVSTLLATGYLRALKLYRTPFAEDRGLLKWRKEPPLSREEFIRDRDKRFAVLEALLKTDVREQTLIYVPVNEYPLFGSEDAGRLLEQALSDTRSSLVAKWILCFKALAGRINLGEHSQQIEKLHLARPDLIESASEMREHAENYARYSQEMNQKWEQQEDETKKKRESDQQRIDRGIKSVLAQRAPAAELFAEIAIWIHSEDGMTSLGSIDITASPGWRKLSAEEQESLIVLAERYLREGRIEQTAPDRLTLVVAQAFSLLRLATPDKYQSLSEEVWARSAVELLKPAFNEYMELLYPLFNMLAEKFPNTAERALIQTIRQQLTVGNVSILRHWGNRLSEKQSQAVMRLAQDTSLKVEEQYAILSALAECGRADAVTTYLAGC